MISTAVEVGGVAHHEIQRARRSNQWVRFKTKAAQALVNFTPRGLLDLISRSMVTLIVASLDRGAFKVNVSTYRFRALAEQLRDDVGEDDAGGRRLSDSVIDELASLHLSLLGLRNSCRELEYSIKQLHRRSRLAAGLARFATAVEGLYSETYQFRLIAIGATNGSTRTWEEEVRDGLDQMRQSAQSIRDTSSEGIDPSTLAIIEAAMERAESSGHH